MNVFTDVAGNYLTSQALINKMPKTDLLFLGDLNDRGSKSKEVIQFVMNNGECVQSNHGHMFVEAYLQRFKLKKDKYYDDGIFEEYNGGDKTIESYGGWDNIPYSDIEYLKNLPTYIIKDNFVFTHAPLHITKTLEEASDLGPGFANNSMDLDSDASLIWNRFVPRKPHPKLKGMVNVFGHNSSDAVKVYTTQYTNGIKCWNNDQFQEVLSETKSDEHQLYGICLDTSGGKILTGLNIETMTIYQQEYID